MGDQLLFTGGAQLSFDGKGGVSGLSSDGSEITSTLPILLPDGTRAAPALAWANDTDNGWYRTGAGWRFGVGDTHIVALSATGVAAVGSGFNYAGLVAETPTEINPTIGPGIFSNFDAGFGGQTNAGVLTAVNDGILNQFWGHDKSSPYSFLLSQQVEAGRQQNATSNGTTTLNKTSAFANAAVGDCIFIFDGSTAADYGVYRIVTVSDNDNVVLDRVLSGSDSDVDFYILKDGVAFIPTDGTNGNLLKGFSHQNKPLQIGGDALAATGHSLGAEDILIGGNLETSDIFVDGTLTITSDDTAGSFAMSVSDADILTIAATTGPVAEVDETKFSHKLQVTINSSTYYIMLTDS